jgi:hypothetical protein
MEIVVRRDRRSMGEKEEWGEKVEIQRRAFQVSSREWTLGTQSAL